MTKTYLSKKVGETLTPSEFSELVRDVDSFRKVQAKQAERIKPRAKRRQSVRPKLP